MSLISLLIALAAERYLSSSAWQFNVYYLRYLRLFKRFVSTSSPTHSIVTNGLFLVAPVVLCYFLLGLVNDGLLHFILSTVVLISCFGCVKTRDSYKQYLMAAFRGESTTCEMHHKQLLQDKNLPEMGFGQMLIWLNYRYFIAIMIFFVIFGAPGALFYRLAAKLNETGAGIETESEINNADAESNDSQDVSEENCDSVASSLDDDHETPESSSENIAIESDAAKFNQQLLFWLDWLPVRLVSFGYMLVGHFSRALPIWLENLFDIGKPPHQILITVAQKSEDFMIDKEDCTAEPCLLVRLAKRSLLLCLAVIAILILTGVIS